MSGEILLICRIVVYFKVYLIKACCYIGSLGIQTNINSLLNFICLNSITQHLLVSFFYQIPQSFFRAQEGQTKVVGQSNELEAVWRSYLCWYLVLGTGQTQFFVQHIGGKDYDMMF